jgi:hypothetical protein
MKRPIGYQVVDSNGNYPDGFYSFEILKLSAALFLVQQNKKRWRLLPIFKGDIEEPTFVSYLV